MIKHVFLDFNGTLINDIDLCLDLLNEFLNDQNKPSISKQRYKEIFTFPIKDYYRAAGIDFNIESYESLAIKFIQKYQPASLKCGLFDCVVPTLKKLKEKNIKIYLLSASEKHNLTEQCISYDIAKYFDAILGIDNIHAESKTKIGIDYIKNNKIDVNEAVFIGDTLHDFETANAMNISCRLVKCGHQDVARLKKANVKIYDDISGILEEI